MSGLARQPSQRGGSERDHPTPPLLLLLVLGPFSNSISAELNDGLWKARLAPPPRRGKVPRRRGLASICSSPFWVSIFLGPFSLLPQIARNSENNLSTTDGARPVCDQWGSPDRPEGQIVLHSTRWGCRAFLFSRNLHRADGLANVRSRGLETPTPPP